MPLPLSVAVITKNEASRLAACLASVAGLADEVVVVDSGSSDGTVALAEALGARVIVTDWPGFGVQKNRAVAACRNDWVLCLDADERLSPELAASLRALFAASPQQRPARVAYQFARCNHFLGRYLRHGEGYPDWSLRLFDRRAARWSEDPVHETVRTDGPVGRLTGDLIHDSADRLENYLAKQNRYTSLAAQDTRRQAVAGLALRMITSPLLRFVKFYFLRRGFLDGLPGLIHILIGCINSFSKYAKRIERQLDLAAARPNAAPAADR
ncbi:MAG TPA: glycosyltransferase family 2 protein, partial [Rhodocyclaceae bacterium]|nr:glycosyltransferase family 2 protein [Rhodocyclaceae bacterium]